MTTPDSDNDSSQTLHSLLWREGVPKTNTMPLMNSIRSTFLFSIPLWTRTSILSSHFSLLYFAPGLVQADQWVS